MTINALTHSQMIQLAQSFSISSYYPSRGYPRETWWPWRFGCLSTSHRMSHRVSDEQLRGRCAYDRVASPIHSYSNQGHALYKQLTPHLVLLSIWMLVLYSLTPSCCFVKFDVNTIPEYSCFVCRYGNVFCGPSWRHPAWNGRCSCSCQ